MKALIATATLLLVTFAATPVVAQFIERPTPPPPSLKDLALPTVVDRVSSLPLVDDGGGGFIKDEQAAILLGKALFWDTQAGSNGVACGSCHYHAGADNRNRNQLNPGTKGGNGLFDPTAAGGGGPNYVLVADDYPFHQLANPTDRDSNVLFDTDDVTSSQGTFSATFNDVEPGNPLDDCNIDSPDFFGFHLNNINVRRVEPRNTPSVINAVFNHRNFWDGRANNIFNGVDNTGLRNADAKILTNQGGSLAQTSVAFENSSLASQAVGPMVSDFEMACTGRIFPKIGKKMLSLDALAAQRVHPSDSVLGGVSAHPNNGLGGPGNKRIAYTELVEAAFADWLWDSNELVDVDGQPTGNVGSPSGTDEYTQMESNFALIWGLAIMAYERTLVSDDTPFDQWAEADASAGRQIMPITNGHSILTQQEIDGMNLFFENKVGERGLCSTCHQGPTFTTAAFPFSEEEESGEFPEKEQLVERMKMGDANTITENLFRFSISGAGSIGGYTISGRAGSWSLPDSYPATVGGNMVVNNCERETYSYLTNQDTITFFPPGSPFPVTAPDTSTRDALIVLEGCGEWLQIEIVDNGPGFDTATVQPIFPIVKQSPQQDPPPILPDGQAVSGAVVGDFTLNGPALYDTAFYNIGIRPTSEDPGVGAVDGAGIPLSFTKQWQASLTGSPILDDLPLQLSRLHLPFSWYGDGVFYPGGLTGPTWPQLGFFPCPPGSTSAFVPVCVVGQEEGKGHGAYPKYPTGRGFFIDLLQATAINNMPTAVDGAFKTAGLRNAELTGPYFHNGGQLTLDQVLEFYNRGGDFAVENVGNLSPNIHPLGLDETQRASIVAFLKALTDERVRCEQAPFDHPEIRIAAGARGSGAYVTEDKQNRGQSKDQIELIQATGAGGLPGNFAPCLQGFLE